jgi:hypothetical protein
VSQGFLLSKMLLPALGGLATKLRTPKPSLSLLQ